jgi:DNA-directed RNA polymerase alpha subunit
METNELVNGTLREIERGLRGAVDFGCDIPEFTNKIELSRNIGGCMINFSIPFRFNPKKHVSDDPILDTPIRKCGFTTGVANCLIVANVETVGDLVRFSGKELLKFRYLGKAKLWEIEEFLQRNNLHLKEQS